jgi:hypothetical protein
MGKLRRLRHTTMRSTLDTQQQRRSLLLPGQCRPHLHHLVRFAANHVPTLLRPSSVLVATGSSVTIATDVHTLATMPLTTAFQPQRCTHIASNARNRIRLQAATSISYASGAVRAIDPSVRHAVRPVVLTILPHQQPTRARPRRPLRLRTSSDMSV